MRRTVAEHQGAVLEVLTKAWSGPEGTLRTEDVGERMPLAEAAGRVLAGDLVAPLSLPPFANSQMDGFAILSDTSQPEYVDSIESTTFTVTATIPAGVTPSRLPSGMAAPIMTGAMMPDGADAVVPVEKADPARFLAEGESVVLPLTRAGTYVRAMGSDLAQGELAIAAGTLLNAAHIGLASALGCVQLTVRRKPRVLLVTTGDEVMLPGDPRASDGLPAGKIFDANMALLRTSFQQAGVEVVLAPVVADQPQALLEMLESYVGPSARGGIDLIVSTGGISAGAFEVVKQALDDASVEFVSVALQPGGPQALGTFLGVPFIGFPGNPVSGVVSFELFLRPALSEILGAPEPRRRVLATLEHALDSPAGKYQVRRGIYEGPEFESAASVREVGGPSSHLLASLAQANALIHIPAGVTELESGAKVEVWLL
ncbi:molybdopterin molybdotransferase MoeA [Arthrobacter cryoconiti]|uniref:Molybdopterin molybdenumtransferase n=1 Tax=Arthrobacter cryoconiti TaxID=748907 RepID=A0ABV8R2N8_9MICC|nr:gephyrin-like molybdotransferase Glp [Arthrobacter cryoconiti]MCC9067225.1 molybdopterin molybdotransferase MoeA [Arthrobacter cryoconiti]